MTSHISGYNSSARSDTSLDAADMFGSTYEQLPVAGGKEGTMPGITILELTGLFGAFNNPAPPNPPFDTSAPNWSGAPFNFQTSLTNDNPAWEWVPILDQHNDYDNKLVGVSGIAFYPPDGSISSTDNPFLHPFNFDYEFFIAPDPQFLSLLAPSNTGTDPRTNKVDGEYNGGILRAAQLGIVVPPQGILGVETDQRLVPVKYRIQDGDSVVVFGRWIVDTGHDDFHSEIHPPLLLARARGNSQNATQSTVIGRPYLVSQDFGDGGIRQHLINQIKMIPTGIPGIPGNTQVEAHPKILTPPFSGLQIMSYIVRPPLPPNPGDVLHLSYHFTVRSGVAVQLVNVSDNAVKVVIEMNDTAYKPVPLPPKNDWNISLDDLDKLKPGLGTTIKEVLVAVALGFPLTGFPDPSLGALVSLVLSRGVLTDLYDEPSAASVHDTEITSVTVDKLGAGPHFSVDDGQPFPVYGFLDVQWGPSKTKTEGKEGKEKEKEKEASKDNKENKDNAKDKESHKDTKDGAKEIEQNLALGGTGRGNPAAMLFSFGRGSSEAAEPPLATGQAFIRAEERPDVGGSIAQQSTQD